MEKYAIHPGNIESKHDGDIHWIGYGQLIKLYGVDPKECFCWGNQDLFSHGRLEKYVHLYPDFDGKYKLPLDKP